MQPQYTVLMSLCSLNHCPQTVAAMHMHAGRQAGRSLLVFAAGRSEWSTAGEQQRVEGKCVRTGEGVSRAACQGQHAKGRCVWLNDQCSAAADICRGQKRTPQDLAAAQLPTEQRTLRDSK
eukprot:364542-Chlamydomonas_euryale.AAC.3